MLKQALVALLLPLAWTMPAGTDQPAKRYAIMDNDWGSAGFVPFLIALDGGMDVLALVSGEFFSSPMAMYDPDQSRHCQFLATPNSHARAVQP